MNDNQHIIHFIKLIENHPCLYNSALQEYSRKDITERAWAKIAKIMGWTVTDCKDKWKNLRTGFVRSLKPVLNGSSLKLKKPYYLHNLMQFVLPYVKSSHLEKTGKISPSVHNSKDVIPLPQTNEDTTRTTNDTEAELIEILNDEQTNTIEINPKRIETNFEDVETMTTKKRKHQRNELDTEFLKYLKEKRDRDKVDESRKMFLLSLLPDVNKLSDDKLRQFKIKTLMLLENMLTQQQQQDELSRPLPQTFVSVETMEDRYSPLSYASSPCASPVGYCSNNSNQSNADKTAALNVDTC